MPLSARPRRPTITLAWALVVPFCAVQAQPTAAPATTPAHHRPDGSFQNRYIDFAPRSMGEVLAWQWRSWRDGLPPKPQQPTPQAEPDLAFIQTNAKAGGAMQPAVTWIGHASVLAQLGGLNVITDPMLSERQVRPGLTLAQLPHIDAVLVSHNHYDHLDEDSVVALNAQAGGPPLFVVPLGMKAWLAERGITNAVELDWWQSHQLGTTEIVLTPVQHWSGRGLNDRLKTLWGGYAVFAPELHLFFAGDTGYSKDFADIRARFAERQGARGFDIALIPVGAYEPRWFMSNQHVNPTESVQIHLDLLAKRSLGIHWGTFNLTDEALDVPPAALAAARKEKGLSDDDFFVLAVGQTRKLPAR
jgi:N-acyl-phosphatidylethanolamine-hydrolysing phospholipase D